MKFRKLPAVLAMSFMDLLRENYLYHSGALTYYFLISAAPLTMASIYIAGFLPFFGRAGVESFLDMLFPESVSRFAGEMIGAQPKGSILALCLSYLFSVGLLRNLSRAFSYVSEGILGGKGEIFNWLAAPLLILSLLGAPLLFFASLYLKTILLGTTQFLSDLLQMLPVVLYVFFLYSLFLRRRVGILSLLIASALASGSVLLVQSLFTWYVVNVFEKNPLYGSLSGLVAFLIWINLVFLSLLLGARLIYRLERP